MKLSRNPRIKKRLFILIVIIAVVFTNPLIYKSTVELWQPGPVRLPTNKTYEAGIVLGGMAGYDKYERGHFGGNADRFIQAANLYHQGINKKIIISGGTGSRKQDEPAEYILRRTELIANGGKEPDIIMERR